MSSSSKEISPAFMMTEDIVFVSMNYRLGILAFLRLNNTSLNVPGNAGLKDQVLALQWIQKNIRTFGGDPKNVILSGNSAGAISVNYHILSPLSKNLFHKAIFMSGSVLNPWATSIPNQLDIMKFLKYDVRNERKVLKFLMDASASDLVIAQWNFELVSENLLFLRVYTMHIHSQNPLLTFESLGIFS